MTDSPSAPGVHPDGRSGRNPTGQDNGRLRKLQPSDWSEASELICISMNYWDRAHGRPPTFSGPSSTIAFCEIYERLDPGCCFVMEAEPSGRLMGLCFYRERETHMSVGVMAVHPNYFGAGVARQILGAILDITAERRKPTRLISNAANLDSFSLYTRAGFVPRALFQGVVFHRVRVIA